MDSPRPGPAEEFARAGLDVVVAALSKLGLDFKGTTPKIDPATAINAFKATARLDTPKGPAAPSDAVFGGREQRASGSVGPAPPTNPWSEATGVPVVPIVAESDAGISQTISTGRSSGRWKIETSIQQWPADLPRFVLGQPTTGGRTDTTLMLTVGSQSYRVGLGRITAIASGSTFHLETQEADIVQLGVGKLDLSVWNDTRHGTDQSIYTGGGKADIGASRWNIKLGDGVLEKVSIGLRVGTGIPDRSQTEQVGGHRQYKKENIEFADASKGHVIVSGTFRGPDGREIVLTGVISSGDVQNLIQSKLLHTGLGLAPEFPNTKELGAFISLDLRY